MACKVETRPGELILAEVSYAGDYGSRYDGYIPGYKGECKLSYVGSSLVVGSGVIIRHGKRIIIDDEGLTEQILQEPSADKTYFAFLKVDMNDGSGNLEVSDSPTPPGFSEDDLFLNYTTGVNWIVLGTFVNSTTGIKSVTNTLKTMTGPLPVFKGSAAEGDSIDLQYPIDILKSAKHIDLRFGTLPQKMQGIVDFENTKIYFSGPYRSGTSANVANPLCQLQFVSGTTWKVVTPCIIYLPNGNNNFGPKVSEIEVQF